MRIAHLSDFHFTKLTFNPLRLFPKRIFGHLNWLIHRKKTFDHQQLECLPELFSKLGVDLILFSGDFTTTAMDEEFLEAKKWIAKMPAPFIAIPGNHDKYTKRSIKRFYQYFEPLKVHSIGNNWWVLPMDTTCPNPIRSAKGIFKNATELEDQIAKIPGNIIILNHYPFFQQESADRSLEGGYHLEAIIRKNPKIKLYLHGHTHRHCIADLRADHLPIILDSGSCSSKNGSWNFIDLTEDRCNVTPYFWQNGWIAKEKQEFIWHTKII